MAHIERTLTDKLTMHDSREAKSKRSGEKKPYRELRTGASFNRDAGEWYEEYRLIDRDNDRYVKRLTTSDGEVTRDVDARLSEHQGHGADKSRPKAHP
jgi:hypothetical protein